MLRRFVIGILLALAGTAAYLVATAPHALDHEPQVPDIGEPVDRWLTASEAAVHNLTPIIPGAEKRIRWFGDAPGSRTRLSVVYLHGFSATRQETAPLSELLADALQANLYESRLAGHGLEDAPLAGTSAEQWLDDAAEAFSIGALIGERIIVIGVSTGATLALAMSDHPTFDAVAALVLMSPNFAPYDDTAELLTKPGGPQLARLMLGETRSWVAANAEQERYWSTTYPTAALVEMMRLVDRANHRLPLSLGQHVLAIYSPNDRVISSQRIRESLALIESPDVTVVEIEESGDPSDHVLAGSILAPENNGIVLDHIYQFVHNADL